MQIAAKRNSQVVFTKIWELNSISFLQLSSSFTSVQSLSLVRGHFEAFYRIMECGGESIMKLDIIISAA